jgi:GxxExxY protein
MNRDKQGFMDGQMLDELTEKIIGCAYQVSNTIGIGFVEKVYENAHVHELRKNRLYVQQQYPIKVVYDDITVGEFFVDILVENLVLVELKAVSALNNEHLAQALNYLRASKLPVWLLINFGRLKIQIRRLHPSPNWKSTIS